MKTFFTRPWRMTVLFVGVVLLVTLLSESRCTCGHSRRVHRYGGIGWNQKGESWLLPTCPKCLERSVLCFWLPEHMKLIKRRDLVGIEMK